MTTKNQETDNSHAIGGILIILSLLIGLSSAFLIFVFFLQTTVVSGSRLALASAAAVLISGLNFWVSQKWVARGLVEVSTLNQKLFVVCVILPAIFLPLYYVTPAYPQSPLLRPWTDLVVQFGPSTDSGPISLTKDDIKLIMDQDVVNTDAFLQTGDWQSNPNGLSLSPGSTGALQWTNPAGPSISLTILPPSFNGPLVLFWDGSRTTVQIHQGSQQPIVLARKFSFPWGTNLLLFLSEYVLISWAGVLLLVFLRPRFGYLERFGRWRYFYILIFVFTIPLTILTVKLQIDGLQGGLKYLSEVQLARHTAVLTGQAPDPWQYRVLSEVIAEAIIRAYQLFPIQNAYIPAFITFRLLQNAAIFLLALTLYKKITNSNLLALLAILILASGMKNAFYDNDLSFNTYFDIIFYILSALLLLARNYYAVVIVMIFAALNRETSGVIPFLMAATIMDESRPLLRKSVPVLLSVGIFAIIFIGLRILNPDRPLYIPFKHLPGFPLLLYNLTRQFSWNQLFGTLGLIPFLGMFYFFTWPRLWQRFFLILVPVWFAIHLFASVIDETRLFLVPQALIFIPGILFAMQYLLSSKQPIPQKNGTFHESR